MRYSKLRNINAIFYLSSTHLSRTSGYIQRESPNQDGYAHQVSGLVLRGQLFDTVELIESISDVKEDCLDGSTLGNTSLEALCRRISRHQEQLLKVPSLPCT
jgi:hypothetical protein